VIPYHTSLAYLEFDGTVFSNEALASVSLAGARLIAILNNFSF
jgi:hypothetical protein